jgi:uncharacterized protein YjbI with pentapeptide repeats
VSIASILSANRDHFAGTITGETFIDQSPVTHDHHFTFVEFNKVSFIRCDLTEAHFSDSTLRNVVFSECDLSGATFCGSLLLGVSFVDCTMPRTSLEAASTHRLCFSHCTDFSPVLESAALEGEVSFPGTDLDNVSFFGSFVGSDLVLPDGYRLSAVGPSGSLDFNGIADLRRVIFDADYLSAFASPESVDLLLSEHHDLPVVHLIALLRAMSPA